MQVPPLNDTDLNGLLKQPLVAKIGSHDRDGEIRVTPIWFEPEADGSILMNTFEDSALVRNVRRNSRCSIAVDSRDWPYIGVHYWGTAEVTGPENDADAIGKTFAKYFEGDVAAATDYGNQLMGWGKRVFVRFRPSRKTTWDFRQG
jgi:PPOX class probable F420-dependent enzyme